MGHEDQFRQSTPSGCCVKRKRAVVGIHWNGRDPPRLWENAFAEDGGLARIQRIACVTG
jgi:hypothetical protein